MSTHQTKVVAVDAAQWDGSAYAMRRLESTLGVQTATAAIDPLGRVVFWHIMTPDGGTPVTPGDWIVRHPVAFPTSTTAHIVVPDDIFAALYEEAP